MSSGRRHSSSLVRVPRQLTLDGGEVPHPPKRHQRALSEAAAAALAVLEERGAQKAVDVGRGLHKRTGCVLEGPRWNRWKGSRSTACCPYASSHGYNALHQLEERDLAARLEDGRWQAV